jgi:hypothetical protein
MLLGRTSISQRKNTHEMRLFRSLSDGRLRVDTHLINGRNAEGNLAIRAQLMRNSRAQHSRAQPRGGCEQANADRMPMRNRGAVVIDLAIDFPNGELMPRSECQDLVFSVQEVRRTPPRTDDPIAGLYSTLFVSPGGLLPCLRKVRAPQLLIKGTSAVARRSTAMPECPDRAS